MADRHGHGSPEGGPDPLGPLFSGLGDELSPALRPPGPTAVRAVVARRSHRRRVAGGVAAALTLVLVVLGGGVLLRGPLGGDSIVANRPSPSATGTPDAAGSASPTPTSPIATPTVSPSPEVSAFTRQAMLEIDLVLPDWPGNDSCPRGGVDFTDGQFVDGDHTLTMLPGGRHPVYADALGDDRQEVFVRIRCARGDTPLGDALVALALRPDGALGAQPYVFAGTPAERTYRDFSVGGRRVNVTVVERFPADGRAQARTFEWDGSRFELIAGPARFPSTGTSDGPGAASGGPAGPSLRDVDWRNATLDLPTDATTYSEYCSGDGLTFRDGRTTSGSTTVLQVPHPDVSPGTGPGPTYGVVTGDHGEEAVVVFACRASGTTLLGTKVALYRAGADGSPVAVATVVVSYRGNLRVVSSTISGSTVVIAFSDGTSSRRRWTGSTFEAA